MEERKEKDLALDSPGFQGRDSQVVPESDQFEVWEDFGHQFEAGELERLKRSIVEMALSRIDGQDDLYVGG